MKAFILAAGEGRRMRPLTLERPKPLLKVDQHSLIEHQIFRLKSAGITDLVINTHYLGEQIVESLGDGSRYGVQIFFSNEPDMLETGGALFHARERLGEEPFLLVNGDVWCEADLGPFVARAEPGKVRLLMVPNPEHNPHGDFCLYSSGRLGDKIEEGNDTLEDGYANLTFSGISVIDSELFFRFPGLQRKFRLKTFFDWAISQGLLTGELYDGEWIDVGTPERLEHLRSKYRSS